MNRFLYFVFLGFLFLHTSVLPAQQNDTLAFSIDIEEVVVTGHSGPMATRSSAPLQMMNRASLHRLNVIQLSDAVKYFSGTVVKDYGGIGGMKTVSVRGLEAQHTGVAYDGIPVSDFQTGQVDLGRFSTEGLSKVTLSNATGGDIFQPARLFASGSILNINTITPVASNKKPLFLQSGIKTGSFGYFQPFLLVGTRLSPKVFNTFQAEYLSSHGKYPYTLSYGGEGDSTSRETRRNTDVKTLHLESGLHVNWSDQSKLTAKLYWYQSERGLPGAVILYNPYSDQRLWDQNFFGQFRFEQKLSDKLKFMVNGKFNWTHTRYLNPEVYNELGKEENFYYQREYYLSGAFLYSPGSGFSFSYASDGSLNNMSVNFTDFATPRRYTWLNAFAAKWERDRWLLSAQILGTLTFEQVKRGEAAPDRQKLIPAFSLSYRISRDESLRLRLFYKQNYRLPTFNDLYYQRSGNINLKPEDASQWNAGLVFAKAFPGKIRQISFSADGYYNRVKNKILAVPRHNLFLWSMSNIGTVEISGLDVVAESVIKPSDNWSLVLGGGYTYQRAVDLSDPEGNTYKHQIPYTPRHSGSARLALVLPWADIAYTCFWSGERYILKQNTPENRLPGYAEQGVSVRKTLMVGKISSVLQAEVLNITDKTYEVVKSYPMPGRHFRLGLTVEL